MGSVSSRLRHRALVVLAALLLALAVAPASASAQTQRDTSSLVRAMTVVALGAQASRPRTPRGEDERVVAPAELPRPAPPAASAANARDSAREPFPASDGRYRYLIHCALLC